MSIGDRWIIDSGFSHQEIDDKNNFETSKHYKGCSVNFCNDVPCLVKGKGLIRLTHKIRCNNAYWVEGLNNKFF